MGQDGLELVYMYVCCSDPLVLREQLKEEEEEDDDDDAL